MEDQLLIRNKVTQKVSLPDTLRQACKKIAPVWPLESFVAVNPYLGLIDQKFESTAQLLATVGGIQMTLPTSFYMDKIKEGKIIKEDLKAALDSHSKSDVEQFIKTLENSSEQNPEATIATFGDIATQVTGKDWNRFVTSRISVWAASYFDNGQATWAAADKKADLFSAWKAEATVDRTPEIMGLKNFRNKVNALPNDPLEAAEKALDILEVSPEAMPLYLHRLLLQVGGWSAYTARLDWDNQLYGGNDGKQMEFLAVLLSWEACLFQCLDSTKLRVKWIGAKQNLAKAKTQTALSKQLESKLILQEAFDRATQRTLIQKFSETKSPSHQEPTHIKAQAIFCIDVRSEVYRRNLELVDPQVETLGFAGFFAFPIKYVPLAHEVGEANCPVLIKTGPTILEEIPNQDLNRLAYQKRLLSSQAKKVWRSFKSGAVTCFSFVSPLGLSYLVKLFTDSFGITRPVPNPAHGGLKDELAKAKSISLEAGIHRHEAVGIPLQQRVQMAKNALKAMSLTSNFADFVLIVGHGATTVNNPHATGLDCGACGGHTGEANAKVAAAVLNDKAVREALKTENLIIPDTTLFLACLHDTTADEVTIYNEHEVRADKIEALIDLKKSLGQAGHAARTERALRMSIDGDVDAAIKGRSNDWSQVRPEWGLAGCSAFVVAPRARTKHLNLGGRSFLHSYDWQKDAEFAVLELIMTAPMVVTSWINLQYYASTVDNKTFGSGNKTLHNVTAGVGVLEGFSGDLRVGLPIQSVYDGKVYQHEPVKLNVIIEAPLEAMNAILKKHTSVRHLCDNGWIHLLTMDAKGKVSHRYIGDMSWENV